MSPGAGEPAMRDQLMEPTAPLRLGHRAERPHPSDRAEGRRQHNLPHRALDRLSATRAGVGPGPGPLKVPADQLPGMLGITSVSVVKHPRSLALTDTTLA